MRSSRRSAAKAKRRKTPVYFIDESLGAALAEDLRALGVKAVAHSRVFGRDGVDDTEWAHTIGRRGLVAITKDTAIRTSPLERNAVRMAKLRMFALCSGTMGRQTMAAALGRARKSMDQLVAAQPGPFIARLGSTGDVLGVDVSTPSGWKRVAFRDLVPAKPRKT